MTTRELPKPDSGNRPHATSVDELLERARARIIRVMPEDLEARLRLGALVIDIRPAAQREEEGSLPGALILERNVLEWRLDPTCSDRLTDVHDHERLVIVVCSEGYASSLAAASIKDLGYSSVGDLKGGYKAWARLMDGADSQSG